VWINPWLLQSFRKLLHFREKVLQVVEAVLVARFRRSCHRKAQTLAVTATTVTKTWQKVLNQKLSE